MRLYRLLYGKSIGDRLVEFNGLITSYSDDDQGVAKYDFNIKSSGKLKYGALIQDPRFYI